MLSDAYNFHIPSVGVGNRIENAQSTIMRSDSTCIPCGGIGILTDRDQLSWVLLNNPKNTLPLKENPKKYLPKSETLKGTLLKHNLLSES